MTTLLEIIVWTAIVYFVLLALMNGWLVVFTFVARRRAPEEDTDRGYDVLHRSPFTPPVSILVAPQRPRDLLSMIRGLRLLEFGEYEVVVVVGSAGGQFSDLCEAFDLRPVPGPVRRSVPSPVVREALSSPSWSGLRVLRTAGGDGPELLNAALNVARYPIVCTLSSETSIEQDALLRTVRPFMDHPAETTAVMGIVEPREVARAAGATGRAAPTSTAADARPTLPSVGGAELTVSSAGNDAAWLRPDALAILSEAFCLFRKDAVVAVQGWRGDADVPHLDLALRLQQTMRWSRRPSRMVFADDVVASVPVTDQIGHLLRAAGKRQRALIESLSAVGSVVARPRYGALGLFWLPAAWLFEIAGPFIEIIGYVTAVAGVAAGAVSPLLLGLLLVAAIGCRSVLSAAIVMLRVPPRRRQSTVSIGRLIAGVVVLEIGYRQAAALWRAAATVRTLRRPATSTHAMSGTPAAADRG